MNIVPITKNIIFINIILYIITELFFPSLVYQLAVYMPTSPHFASWQIITHMFMHGGFVHLLFNMLTLWSFGSVLEQSIGGKQYVIIYFLSGLGAFILFNFWNYYQVYELTKILVEEGVDVRDIYLSSANVGGIAINETEAAYKLRSYLSMPMLGASGAVFGIVAGFATLFPNARMYMMLIPFPIKAKYLVPIIVIISAYLGARQFEWDNVAHFAHIGGALVGWIMMINWKKDKNIIS